MRTYSKTDILNIQAETLAHRHTTVSPNKQTDAALPRIPVFLQSLAVVSLCAGIPGPKRHSSRPSCRAVRAFERREVGVTLRGVGGSGSAAAVVPASDKRGSPCAPGPPPSLDPPPLSPSTPPLSPPSLPCSFFFPPALIK